jgi:hypothetical protein
MMLTARKSAPDAAPPLPDAGSCASLRTAAPGTDAAGCVAGGCAAAGVSPAGGAVAVTPGCDVRVAVGGAPVDVGAGVFEGAGAVVFVAVAAAWTLIVPDICDGPCTSQK